MVLKKCTRCGRNLPHSSFSKSGKYLRGDCKQCHNSYVRKTYHEQGRAVKRAYYQKNKEEMLLRVKERTYGLTRDHILTMTEQQQGRCKICDRVMDCPNIDHCHTTQQVRGLLCTKCNAGLGQFEDNVMFLHRAIQYLQLSGQ